MVVSNLKDLVELHEFFEGHDIDDGKINFATASIFEISLYKIQQASNRALEKVSRDIGFDKGRVKSSKSFLNKCAYLKITDLTTVQDVVAITLIRPTIQSCYETLENLFKEGYVPYFKVLDTLRSPINKYGSLDTHLKKDSVSFELQIRTPEFDEVYHETHGCYKDRTTAIDIDVNQMSTVRKEIETLRNQDVLNLSTNEIFKKASYAPKMCDSWRTLKIDNLLKDMLNKYNIEFADEVIIPNMRVFV